MNRIDDERILFYFRHQQRIEEWAALAKEASNTAHQFLCSCEPDVEGLAHELGPDISLFASLDQPYPKLFLCRPAWFADDSPRMAIGLEWQRSSVGFLSQGKTAYVGTWVDFRAKGGAALHGAVSRGIRDAGLVKEYGLETARMWWPTYRYEPAPEQFWTDLTSYRLQMIESIRFFWTTFEPIMRESIRV